MTRTADHAAFLRAVIARPDDDGSRMLFADWLDDHDQPERAEFIRVQCERATLPPCLCFAPGGIEAGNGVDCRPCILRRRERELLDALIPGDLCRNAVLWAGPAALLQPRGGFEFHRGFVSHVTCSWPAWCGHAAAIRAATPLERVTLTTVPEWHWIDRRLQYRDGLILDLEYPGIAFELP